MGFIENQYKTINSNSSCGSNLSTKTSLNTADFDNNPDKDNVRRLASSCWECFKEPLSKMLHVSSLFTLNMENSSVKQKGEHRKQKNVWRR